MQALQNYLGRLPAAAMFLSFGLNVTTALLADEMSVKGVGHLVIDKEMANTSGGDCTFKDSKYDPRELAFRTVVCEYHKYPDETNLSAIDKRIQTLQASQTQGLTASKQALAAMLEGLLHCRKARVLRSDPKFSTDTYLGQSFCVARSQGLDALNERSWQYARIGYARDATGKDVQQLISAISSCFGTSSGDPEPLNAGWNANCNVRDQLSEKRIQELVDDTYHEVQVDYFGPTAEVNRLFVEKKKIADETKARLEPGIPTLETQATGIAHVINEVRPEVDNFVKGPFVDGKRDSSQSLGKVVDDYKDAYALGRAILNRFHDWQDGLLKDTRAAGGPRDVGQELMTAEAEANEARKNLMGHDQPEWILSTIIEKRLDFLNRQPAVRNKGLKSLCAIYYCHLAADIWSEDDFNSTCLRPNAEIKNNPLCAATEAKREIAVDGTKTTLKSLCEAVAFPVDYTRVGLAVEVANKCMKDHKPTR